MFFSSVSPGIISEIYLGDNIYDLDIKRANSLESQIHKMFKIICNISTRFDIQISIAFKIL